MSEASAAAPVEAGRCIKCNLILPVSDTFQRENGDGPHGPRLHRIGTTKRNEIGEVCGPVASALMFHVVAYYRDQAGLALLRQKLPSLQFPEENYDAVVPMWEEAIRSQFRAADQKGAMIVGFQPPAVVVASWAQIGAVYS